jgi:hypothetical protein
MKGYLQLPQVCYGLTVAKRPYTIPSISLQPPPVPRVRAIDVAHVNHRFEVFLETKPLEREKALRGAYSSTGSRFTFFFFVRAAACE